MEDLEKFDTTFQDNKIDDSTDDTLYCKIHQRDLSWEIGSC